ncbi:metal-dependent phosphohydrolase, HD subdomain [Candidatus Vecturithrix granuli]|uniref:Metal-dependent phosphohydrolase, HD subdomain n=1 Tax=Vecturithrix granuli TaxID=1499967 RepID=A0A081C8T1_VECG1|nr:metal-dependent phosphohydrolase, HD subdomain [Candidatus Vecturithrix granuli]
MHELLNRFPLETERLLLRVASPDDAQFLVRYYTENKEYLAPWEPVRSEEFYTLSFWQTMLQEARQEFLNGKSMRLVFSLKSSAPDPVVGVANFNNMIRGVFQACYLGYSIDHRYQGQGLMYEALQYAIAFVFEHLRLHRVMANYMPRNERSGNLLRKLGFIPEGYARNYLKIAGKWEDHILTALVKPEDETFSSTSGRDGRWGKPLQEISFLLKALQFAADKHQHQRRKNQAASPYINHLIEVAELLWEIGNVRDLDTIVAGILHDTIEDTDTSSEELESTFGPKIRRIIEEVTDDKRLPKEVRKQLQIERAGEASWEARQIKLADKICNVNDLHDAPPTDWSLQRRIDYVDWAEHVVRGLRGTNALLEQQFDEVCRQVRHHLLEQLGSGYMGSDAFPERSRRER